MPIGEPILSLENNLDNMFGFVFGEITCPDENTLQIPFIQFRESFSQSVYCPRGTFSRLIFSEEIKYALKYGYKIDIKYCYQFNRGKDLFKDYVNELYDLKSSTKDPVQRATAKLFLNSLYGRFGMKEIENILKIVSKEKAMELDKIHNVSVISDLTDNKYLVRYSGNISNSITKYYKTNTLNSNNKKINIYDRDELSKLGLNKKITVPSAVHIAAAISSYARILINDYKNIPGNPCIMSDTDSAVLPYSLPNNLVGEDLGQMKLVHKINKGIFIKKKLYCIENFNKEITIKSSGIDSSKLNLEIFKKLLKGESVKVERTNFNVDWKTLTINVISSNILIEGLTTKIKTIYNTPDVNFKAISFPVEPIVEKENNKINLNLEEKDNDLFELFTNMEIILFFMLLFLFIILFFIYLIFFK